MLKRLYARWMYTWETRLTTRDSNRVVRPLEWGFGAKAAALGTNPAIDSRAALDLMVEVNDAILADSDGFFGYERPTDFRIEERHAFLYPTNVRPETLDQDARIRQQAQQGKLMKAQFLSMDFSAADAVSPLTSTAIG